ncbi:MarR family winged helix-turn-helix transcriptional regulator [Fodinibacter luteus]
MGNGSPSTSDLFHALTLLQGYSLGLSGVAQTSLAHGGASNVDIGLLTAVDAMGPVQPSVVAESLGRPRSTLSRSITRLLAAGMIESRPVPGDRRRVNLTLGPEGRRSLAAFHAALADYFEDCAPIVKEVLLLLGRDTEAVLDKPAIEPSEAARRLATVGATYVAAVEAAVAPYGIHAMVDRFAVAAIAHRGSIRPRQLADELWLTPAGTTGVLDRLERAGLTRRDATGVADDARGILVLLTPRGEAAAAAIIAVFAQHLEAILEVHSVRVSRGTP